MTKNSPYATSPYGAPLPPPAAALTTAAILPVTIGIGVAAAVGAIVNGVFGAMFPSNAPVEQLYMFGVTIDFAALAAAVLVRWLIVFRWVPTVSTRRLSVFGIIAASLAVLVFVVWLLAGGIEYWTQGMSRYMTGAGALFLLGIPWVTSMVFGEIALRRADSPVNRSLAIGSLALGTIVGVASVAAAVIYGLGLSA